MEATQAAAEAATNGALPEPEQIRSAVSRLASVTSETGLGFLGLSVAVVSAKYALERFVVAYQSAKP
jgi:hypothetical protein